VRIFLVYILVIFSALAITVKAESVVHAPSQSGISYKIEWPVNLTAEMKERMESVSTLVEHIVRLPGSIGGVIKRIERDKILLEKVLHSFGYYGCKVDVIINLNESPVVITFTCELGPVYTIDHIRLESRDNTDIPSMDVNLDNLIGISKGDDLIAEHAEKGREILKKYFSQNGYPFVDVNEPEGLIDHENRNVVLIFPVLLGGKATIYDSIIEPTKNLDQSFIANRLYWKKGDTYDNRVVERTRRLLSQTGLFDNIVVTPKPVDGTPDNAKEKPIVMHVKTTEAAPRALTAGLHYATTQGGEARFSWDHYNLRGHGENLGANLRVAKIRTKARIYYNIPDFVSANQSLKNETYVLSEKTRAYDGQTVAASSKVERQLNDKLSCAIGLSLENGSIKPKTTNIKSPIRLIGVPVELSIDGSNDLLNPTRGLRINASIIPYTGHLGSSKSMMIAQGGASIYIPFQTNSLDEDMGTIAAFAKAGLMKIRNFNDLPPNKRFYGGGNGSVRGYGYQLISPIDVNKVPLGGESLLEFGSEIRYRFTDTFGGVAFIEGGNVSQRNLPNFSKDMLWGAGFGVRYYTEYAPVRLDIAFPLKRRKLEGSNKPFDAAYQFYVSVGQAF